MEALAMTRIDSRTGLSMLLTTILVFSYVSCAPSSPDGNTFEGDSTWSPGHSNLPTAEGCTADIDGDGSCDTAEAPECVGNPDCDGDGASDGLDLTPQGSGSSHKSSDGISPLEWAGIAAGSYILGTIALNGLGIAGDDCQTQDLWGTQFCIEDTDWSGATIKFADVLKGDQKPTNGLMQIYKVKLKLRKQNMFTYGLFLTDDVKAELTIWMKYDLVPNEVDPLYSSLPVGSGGNLEGFKVVEGEDAVERAFATVMKFGTDQEEGCSGTSLKHSGYAWKIYDDSGIKHGCVGTAELELLGGDFFGFEDYEPPVTEGSRLHVLFIENSSSSERLSNEFWLYDMDGNPLALPTDELKTSDDFFDDTRPLKAPESWELKE
jgi:hypothetical protein